MLFKLWSKTSEFSASALSLDDKQQSKQQFIAEKLSRPLVTLDRNSISGITPQLPKEYIYKKGDIYYTSKIHYEMQNRYAVVGVNAVVVVM